MTKQEFEKLEQDVISDEVFETINFVYTFHPAIDEVKGKQQIADIYKLGGMRIIADMYPTACKAKALEEDIRKKQAELESLKESLAALRKGENVPMIVPPPAWNK